MLKDFIHPSFALTISLMYMFAAVLGLAKKGSLLVPRSCELAGKNYMVKFPESFQKWFWWPIESFYWYEKLLLAEFYSKVNWNTYWTCAYVWGGRLDIATISLTYTNRPYKAAATLNEAMYLDDAWTDGFRDDRQQMLVFGNCRSKWYSSHT